MHGIGCLASVKGISKTSSDTREQREREREENYYGCIVRPSRRTETDLDIIMSRMKVSPSCSLLGISLSLSPSDDGSV